MSLAQQVADVLEDGEHRNAADGRDGFIVEDDSNGGVTDRNWGPTGNAAQWLHECSGTLEQTGFRVERVGFPGQTGLPQGAATGRGDTGGERVPGTDPRLRVTAGR